MIAPQSKVSSTESLDRIYLVDSVCDEFEAQWQRGSEPDLKEFLDNSDPQHAQQLFEALAHVDIFYRCRNGESPCIDDYIQRFPDYSGLLTLPKKAMPSAGVDDVVTDASRCIGDYELRDQIGAGSFGTVWRGWHRHLDRIDAIKLPQNRLDGREQIDAFHHEASAAARLNHPNIVRVMGSGEWNHAAYIVFQYIPGPTLKKWKRNEDWNHQQAAELCEKLADALSHAHELKVVHRDLKPGNILIDQSGEPHISDFGLAKRLDIESTIAVDGIIMGTVPYMSPEQIAADHDNIGPSTDIYALGVILYELLTGTLPFRGERAVIMNDILSRDPPSLRRQDKSIPADLETICLKALRKETSRRYQSAAEMHDDLQRFAKGQRIRARRISLPERVIRWGRCHPVQFATRAGTLAVTLTTLAVLGSDALDDGKWDVRFLTDPPGASVVIHQVHGANGELINDESEAVRLSGQTANNVRLGPGSYEVIATHGDRSVVVQRTLPKRPLDAALSVTGNWESLGDNTILWEKIGLR